MRYYYLLLSVILLTSCTTESTSVYKLTTSSNPSEGGAVSPASGEFDEGDQVNLTATPNENWVFQQWQGGLSGSQNPASVTMDSDKTITALFTKREYPLTINIEGEGTVDEQVIQQKSTDYPHGTVVELTANPADGWEFVEWQGDLNGEENPQTISIDEQKSVTAIFGKGKIKVFGGHGGCCDQGKSIITTSDGGYILTGHFQSEQNIFQGLKIGAEDIFILKLDQSKNVEWVKSFGGIHEDIAQSIIETKDGGFIIVGRTSSNDGDFLNMYYGNWDIFILKVDSNGNKDWVKTFGGTGYDEAFSVIENENNYIITGYSGSNDGDFEEKSHNDWDIFVLNVDLNGNKNWLKIFGGFNTDIGLDIDVVSTGGYIITGQTGSNNGTFLNLNSGEEDAFLLKIDENGSLEWVKTYGGSHPDGARSLLINQDGEYIVTGHTYSNDKLFEGLAHGKQDVFVMKVDANGNSIWVNTFGGFEYEHPTSITNSHNSGYVITGETSSNSKIFENLNNGASDIFIMEINADGNIIWVKLYGGQGGELSNYITSDFNSGYIFTGQGSSNDGTFEGVHLEGNYIYILEVDNEGYIR